MLIAIEGCVGAGKSTVAHGLASLRGSDLVLEEFEKNPFLEAFYDDPAGNAFETEFSFLLVHFHQLKARVKTASNSELIADFHLGKDLIYADLNLKDSRADALFRQMYALCSEQSPVPSLLVFLSASTDLLVKRIRQRKRDFEMKIDFGYYDTVNSAYERYFAEYRGKKLRIPMSDWDFVKIPELYQQLGSMIDRELSTR